MRNIMHRDLESVSLPYLNVHVFIIFDFILFFPIACKYISFTTKFDRFRDDAPSILM